MVQRLDFLHGPLHGFQPIHKGLLQVRHRLLLLVSGPGEGVLEAANRPVEGLHVGSLSLRVPGEVDLHQTVATVLQDSNWMFRCCKGALQVRLHGKITHVLHDGMVAALFFFQLVVPEDEQGKQVTAQSGKVTTRQEGWDSPTLSVQLQHPLQANLQR